MNAQPPIKKVEVEEQVEEVEEEESAAEVAEDVMAFVEPADHVPVEEGGHVMKQGWLQKMGKFNTSFQKRWFELEDDGLRYYKTSDGKAGHLSPRGMILIADIIAVADESRRGKNVFEVSTKKRTYYLRAEDENLAREWAQAIRADAKLTESEQAP